MQRGMHFCPLCDKKFYYTEWGDTDCILDCWLLPGP